MAGRQRGPSGLDGVSRASVGGREMSKNALRRRSRTRRTVLALLAAMTATTATVVAVVGVLGAGPAYADETGFQPYTCMSEPPQEIPQATVGVDIAGDIAITGGPSPMAPNTQFSLSNFQATVQLSVSDLQRLYSLGITALSGTAQVTVDVADATPSSTQVPLSWSTTLPPAANPPPAPYDFSLGSPETVGSFTATSSAVDVTAHLQVTSFSTTPPQGIQSLQCSGPRPTVTQTSLLAVTAVSSANSDTGPTTGGTVVSITGTGFEGASAVYFGGVPATSFAVDNDTSMTATSPAEGAGTVNV